ncbi:MAG: Metal-dependent phosphohydrolase [uncultured Thiotrichaceae bacterium]|uniref:Metal-dependent phosphohydrolase n=1 Tax=uncultured Thiotrichaceae bacterium TaxID=298394 RepID=A0A6S6T7P1_9GAMM|nr:MAG: Metal-dependent phosphohydrolase [uncultured Thiotrichaceae bacterium]
MDKLEELIYNSFDVVVFKKDTNGKFIIHSRPTDWLLFFLNHNSEGTYRLTQYFPYLGCFIDEAERHWKSGKIEALTSGPWVEADEKGHELALEASAIKIDGEDILLLQNLGEKYRQEVQRLQSLREGLLSQEKLENEIAKRTRHVQQQKEQIAIKLVSLTSYRDEETEAHVKRIGLYAAAMAKALGWDEQRIDDIRIAATMHDIGKIGIPDKILLKKGKLTDEEFEIMKQHTEIGANLLGDSNIPVLNMASTIALCHHERWDGQGYPHGLREKEIPVTARIVCIVDKYDALIHERVYKKAFSEDVVTKLMKEMSGRSLDPELLELFFELLPIMQRICSEVTDKVTDNRNQDPYELLEEIRLSDIA